MAELFTADYALLWTLVMAVALFFPLRRMIWVYSVRRAERDGFEEPERRDKLAKKANGTSALLALVIAYIYIAWLFGTAG